MSENKSGEILIIEDDRDINDLLATALGKAGYATTQAWSGTEGQMLIKLNGSAYSLVLLDLMLPGISGEKLLEEIRQTDTSLPVIILTAKDELDEKINLLTSGADDYITKPFEIKEVIARVAVQLRHAKSDPSGIDAGGTNARLKYGQLELDRTSRQLLVNGTAADGITKQEFSILELLMGHPKQVFAKEDIFEYAWDEPYMGETKTLDVHISNIRKKIKKLTEVECIETVWGIGYKMKE
ncbi:response regulator transcription factor [Agathobacter sp.]